MRVEFYGLVFETSLVTFQLNAPWRATALEHRLFEAVRNITKGEVEMSPEEWRIHVSEPKVWRAALTSTSRVLKGWQEEADPAAERRTWWWILEGDTNADGYDHAGEPASVWAFLRAGLERGGPGERDKGEDIDLDGFSIRIWGEEATGKN
ncbi:MAG: hypothetical protein K2R98_10555 [Gemmataceae bacterium]|nr:hypothetical protein [Gemmataceae bacterium]